MRYDILLNTMSVNNIEENMYFKYKGGAVVVHNMWTLSTDNIAGVSIDDMTIEFQLKQPAVNSRGMNIYSIITNTKKKRDEFYDAIVRSLGGGFTFVVLTGEHIPLPEITFDSKNLKYTHGMLLYKRRYTIPSSNIGSITVDGNNLSVYIRYPIARKNKSSKTVLTLRFEESESSESFHRQLLEVLIYAKTLHYY
jgi:hypothetical protein